MPEIEHYEGMNKGWWWLTQLLIAEAKCQRPLEHVIYCEQFVEFLQQYGPPPQRERKWGGYASGTR